MINPHDLTSQRFGKLIAASITPGPLQGRTYWHCNCDCGGTKCVDAALLINGVVRSCGCWRIAAPRAHARSGHPLYQRWRSMMSRCFNPSARAFKNYGARGIKVCDRWCNFDNFIADNAHGLQPGLSIDRIDNDGPYSPENCRWATRLEQTINRRTTRYITFLGRTQCVTHWAREMGMHQATLDRRLRRGWSVERAITEPVAPPR